MAVDTAPSERAERGPKHAPRKRKKGRAERGFFRRYWWLFLAVPAAGMLLVVLTLVYVYARLELPSTPPPLQTTYLYDSRGNVIATLHASVDRTIIPFSEMPASLRNAVIATEDKDFYHHGGVDPIGIVRAAWEDLISHQVVQGGSTITQQLVKNVYAGHYVTDPKTNIVSYVIPPRTLGQKIREALLAMKLEHTYSKDQILAKYLNTIYFGHGAYGVQAAAQTYWSTDAKDLTLLESATLAGAITNPSAFDPIVNPSDSKIRRNFVLDRMVATGHLSASRAAELKLKPVKTHPSEIQQRFPPKLGYFIDYTKRALIREFGEADVFGGGLQVRTTLDPKLQHYAEQAVAARLPTPGDPAAALVAIDPRNGGVLAMYGGKNFQKSQVNLATGDGGTGRQTGSAFKMFTLAAAMEDHISLNSYWNGPGTITIPDTRCYTNGAPWTLSNASDSESGYFSLRSATEFSVNTVYAQLVTKVGPDAVVDMAHRLGIRSHLDPVCSITLGTQDVTPLEMTNAYATIDAHGVRRWATPLQKVTDASGSVRDDISTHIGKQVIGPNDANLVTYALESVISGGTGTAAEIGRPAAGKTGTNQNFYDAWFCGYVPQLVACVWVGYPDEQKSMYNVEGNYEVFGGTIPAEIWHDFMSQATANMPVADFRTPSFEGYTIGASPPPAPSPTPSPSPTVSETPSPTPSPSPSPTEPTPSPTATPSAPPSASPVAARALRLR